jgi:hypothetical protein
MEKERGIKITNVDEKKQCDIHAVSKNVCTHGAYEYLGNNKFRCLNKKCNEVVTF